MRPPAEDHPAARVLVVDDEPGMQSTCSRFLARFGHHVGTASTVAEALRRLESEPIDVIVSDLRMPDASGMELLKEVHARWPGVRAILMSGHAQVADAAQAIERGIDRLLLKPFDLEELRFAVEQAVREKRSREELERERESAEALARERESESRSWILRAAHALAAAVEAKDAYTAGHATRVTAYAQEIATVLGSIDLPRMRLAGDLHDVGKIGVPDAVLNKPGRLTEEEFALVARHPIAGARILEPLIDDPLVLGVVRWHHERWDGGGYPDGLAGADIPLPARVLAVADTLDAMTSSRAYRQGLPWDAAVREIHRCAGSQFDPDVVAAFDRTLPRLAALYASGVRA